MSKACPVCASEIDDNVATCPFCGYKILGSTQSFKPIQLDASAAELDRSAITKGELRIVRGPQTGIVIEVSEGTYSIGRDPQCDIFLNDMTVSRNHAQITSDEKGCILSDMNSYNGVWVNDQMIESCLLKTGDVIQIGAFCLVYRKR